MCLTCDEAACNASALTTAPAASPPVAFKKVLRSMVYLSPLERKGARVRAAKQVSKSRDHAGAAVAPFCAVPQERKGARVRAAKQVSKSRDHGGAAVAPFCAIPQERKGARVRAAKQVRKSRDHGGAAVAPFCAVPQRY